MIKELRQETARPILDLYRRADDSTHLSHRVTRLFFCNQIPEVIRVTVSALTLARRMRILSDLRGGRFGADPDSVAAERRFSPSATVQRPSGLHRRTSESVRTQHFTTFSSGIFCGSEPEKFRRQFSEAAGVGFIAADTIRDKGTNPEKRPRRTFSFPRGVFGLARWDSRWQTDRGTKRLNGQNQSSHHVGSFFPHASSIFVFSRSGTEGAHSSLGSHKFRQDVR